MSLVVVDRIIDLEFVTSKFEVQHRNDVGTLDELYITPENGIHCEALAKGVPKRDDRFTNIHVRPNAISNPVCTINNQKNIP